MPVYFRKNALRLTPKVFNAADVIMAYNKICFMADAKMMATAGIRDAIASAIPEYTIESR